MKVLPMFAGVGGALLITATGTTFASAAPAPHGGSRVVGHVYTDDNTAGANTIGAFDRHADGSLAPTKGSPFAAGGAGLGAGLGSQGALQVTADGRFLLAVDAGSNEISVLRVRDDGSLKLVGAPVSSGGLKPVSVTVTDRGDRRDLVYVANAGPGGENYTGFTLGHDGTLTPLAGSTVALPDNASPGDVLFDDSGHHLAGTRVAPDNVTPGLVDSFTVGADGRLTAAAGSPFLTGRVGPIGAEFRPSRGGQLYVSNAHDGPGNGSVTAFDVNRRGVLTTIGQPAPNGQTAPCWVEISHDGRWLYAINTAQPSISSYSIARDGSLTLVTNTPLDPTLEVGAIDARLSPNGAFLYVVDGRSNAVSAFAVDGGSLTSLGAPAPAPAGARPVGLVTT